MALSFPENPVDLGLPSLHTDHWDPLLRACEETGTVVCLHNASSSWTAARSPGAPLELYTTLFPVNALVAAADWLWAGIPTRFPQLDVAFSEGGIGWVPMLIDRIDYVLDHSASGLSAWRDPDLSPTDALRRNFWFCTIDIGSTFALRDHIGVDHIMMETDYPPRRLQLARHPGARAPGSRRRARTTRSRMVTWANAAELFRVDVPELQRWRDADAGAPMPRSSSGARAARAPGPGPVSERGERAGTVTPICSAADGRRRHRRPRVADVAIATGGSSRSARGDRGGRDPDGRRRRGGSSRRGSSTCTRTTTPSCCGIRPRARRRSTA